MHHLILKNLKKKINKLCIGTVKFGNPEYGHSSSQSKKDNLYDFIKTVVSLGVRHFDTSPRYGNSESLIGEFIKNEKINNLIISSKVDNLNPNDVNSEKKILESVYSSLKKLNINFLNYCYLHQNEMEIISDQHIHKALLSLKDMGIIKKIGVSIYTYNECKYSIESGIYDIIQLPVNLVDSSIYNSYKK